MSQTIDDSAKATRVRRFEREVHHVLAQYLVTDLERELPAFASLSAVDVSPDFRSARVFFRLVGEEKALKTTRERLERERPAFQKRLARDVRAKFTPVLRFAFGVAPHHDEIDALLENLHRPRHLTGD